MIEYIFNIYRKAVLRIVNLRGTVAEISRIDDTEHVLHKFDDFFLVRLIVNFRCVDILAAFIAFKNVIHNFSDFFF